MQNNAIFQFQNGDLVCHLPSGLVGRVGGTRGDQGGSVVSYDVHPTGGIVGSSFAAFSDKTGGAGWLKSVPANDLALWPGANDHPPTEGPFSFLSDLKAKNIARLAQ